VNLDPLRVCGSAAPQTADEEEPSYVEAIPDSGIGVQAIALLDLEVRTAIASLVALSSIPAAIGSSKAGHRKALGLTDKEKRNWT